MVGGGPVDGRMFHASDEHGPNSAPCVVLSYDFWRRSFQSDSAIVGRIVDIDKLPFTIIGIAPSGFHGTDLFIWPDFWMPIVNGQEFGTTDFLSWRGSHNIWILGKLKSGITPRQASDNLNSIAQALAQQYPADDALSARLVKPELMRDQFAYPARTFLTGTMLLAFLVFVPAS